MSKKRTTKKPNDPLDELNAAKRNGKIVAEAYQELMRHYRSQGGDGKLKPRAQAALKCCLRKNHIPPQETTP